MRRLSQSETVALLRTKGARRTGPHKMTGHILYWWFCVRCRTIALKNKETRRVLRRACVWED